MKENPSSEPLDAVVSESPLVHFYIPATSSFLERRPRTLKHGDTFAVFDHYGDIVAGDGSPEGLYHEDTRFLSGFQLLINGRRPLLLSSTVQDNNVLLMVDLT
ncbi:MAG: glycogen debranching N-terminal domain-containing protein, partial [Alphaproteobacteria bacterium]